MARSKRKREAPVPPVPDALRKAVEQTYEATAGSVAETRERAGSLVDQVVDQAKGTRRSIEKELRKVEKELQKVEQELRDRLKP